MVIPNVTEEDEFHMENVVLHFGGNNLRNGAKYRTVIGNCSWRIDWYHGPRAGQPSRSHRTHRQTWPQHRIDIH